MNFSYEELIWCSNTYLILFRFFELIECNKPSIYLGKVNKF